MLWEKTILVALLDPNENAELRRGGGHKLKQAPVLSLCSKSEA